MISAFETTSKNAKATGSKEAVGDLVVTDAINGNNPSIDQIMQEAQQYALARDVFKQRNCLNKSVDAVSITKKSALYSGAQLKHLRHSQVGSRFSNPVNFTAIRVGN